MAQTVIKSSIDLFVGFLLTQWTARVMAPHALKRLVEWGWGCHALTASPARLVRNSR
jgi:hypothetical protein